MIRIERSAALAASLLLVAGSAFAAPNLFEGRASITDLKFEVTDLRPDDGVAAGFLAGKSRISGSASYAADMVVVDTWPGLFAQEGYVVSQVKTDQAIKDVSGGPDFKFGLSDNAASFGRSGGEYVAELGVRGSALLDNSFNYGPSAELIAGATITTQSWVLKPGTEVRISGIFDLLIRNDLSQATGGLLDGLGTLQQASSGAFISLSVVGDAAGVLVGPSTVSRTVDSGVLFIDQQVDQSLNEGFELVARNTGNTDVILNSQLAFGTRYTAAVPVPEPSAWALMLAGVALAGLSARRRRAA
jgi:PEP-CTERM motif